MVFDRLALSTHTALDLVLVFVVRVRAGERGTRTKQRSMTPSRARVRKHAGIFLRCVCTVLRCSRGQQTNTTKYSSSSLSFKRTESAVDPLPVGVARAFVVAGARAVAGAVVGARGRGEADEGESYEKTERHRRVEAM